MTPANAPEQPVPRHDRARSWTPVTLGPDVPPPKGAYSPGVRAGDFVYVSGQVPRDAVTGELAGEDIATQARATLRNVERALAAAGAALTDVVSMTVYITDPDNWGTFDATYREIMKPPFPTRAVVGVSLRGILVEISAVAYVGARG